MSNRPIDAAVIPFPKPLITPPVTTIYLKENHAFRRVAAPYMIRVTINIDEARAPANRGRLSV
jgi:hypothetical protein